MAKKGFLALVLAAIVAGGAFAQMGVGGGLVYTGDWTSKITVPGGELKYPWNAVGFYAFWNNKYVELSTGLHFGFGAFKASGIGGFSASEDFSTSYLSIGVMGKWPFAIGEKLVLFPALGAEYYIGLSGKVDGDSLDDPAGDLSHVWFRLGGGIEYNLTDKLFLRGTLLFGIRTKFDLEDQITDRLYTWDRTVGFGSVIKVAVGYKF